METDDISWEPVKGPIKIDRVIISDIKTGEPIAEYQREEDVNGEHDGGTGESDHGVADDV